MPLDKSGTKQAFKSNVKTLMGEVGKSPHVQSRKQALAIAYATKRRAGRADGGEVPMPTPDPREGAADVRAAYGDVKATPPVTIAEDFMGRFSPSKAQSNALRDAIREKAFNTIYSHPDVSDPIAAYRNGRSSHFNRGGKTKGKAVGGALTSQAFNPVMPGAASNGVGMAQPQTMGGVLPAQNIAPMVPAKASEGGLSIPPVKPVKMTTGPLVSSVPGRTDKHFTHVPSGSYVIPADIVSGHGQGNTLAGMNALHNLFKMGRNQSLGMNPSHYHLNKLKRGGGADKHVGKPVPVKLAGGEIVVPPHNVHETMQRLRKRKMTLDEAHKEMDKWVVEHRTKLRRTLAKLPGPVKN